jgi:hypothetical protein
VLAAAPGCYYEGKELVRPAPGVSYGLQARSCSSSRFTNLTGCAQKQRASFPSSPPSFIFLDVSNRFYL